MKISDLLNEQKPITGSNLSSSNWSSTSTMVTDATEMVPRTTLGTAVQPAPPLPSLSDALLLLTPLEPEAIGRLSSRMDNKHRWDYPPPTFSSSSLRRNTVERNLPIHPTSLGTVQPSAPFSAPQHFDLLNQHTLPPAHTLSPMRRPQSPSHVGQIHRSYPTPSGTPHPFATAPRGFSTTITHTQIGTDITQRQAQSDIVGDTGFQKPDGSVRYSIDTLPTNPLLLSRNPHSFAPVQSLLSPMDADIGGTVDSKVSTDQQKDNPDGEDIPRLAEEQTVAPRRKKTKRLPETKRVHECTWQDCGKEFPRRADLIRHERSHANDRPYVCKHTGCFKAFTQRSALTVHERIHTGKKPYHCRHPQCDKSFSDSSSLARHRKLHTTDGRSYTCEENDCHASFCKKVQLMRHTRQAHGKVYSIKENPSVTRDT